MGPEFRAFLADAIVELPSEDSQDDDDNALVADLPLWCFAGSTASHDDLGPPPHGVHFARSINEMTEILVATPIGDDIVEFCGGAARVSTVCLRRRMRCGGNFDIITHFDLSGPSVQDQAMHYLDTFKPLVAVMAPTCTPFGPLSNLNYVLNYESWLASYL